MSYMILGEAGGDAGWREFIYWAQRFYEWPEWDKVERAYKLKIADNLEHARSALLHDSSDWCSLLKRAFGVPNNLTNWYLHTQFLAWVDSNQEDALRALRAMWASNASVDLRVNRFAELTPRHASRGQPLSLASFLMMAEDPTFYTVSRPQPFELAYKLTQYVPRQSAPTVGDKYLQWLEFLDMLRVEAARAGYAVRDRLDAQGLVWSVTRWNAEHSPVSDWPAEDRERLLCWRSMKADPSIDR